MDGVLQQFRAVQLAEKRWNPTGSVKVLDMDRSEFGASFARQGTCRDNSSISRMVKSICPSCAAAKVCKIVLVEPPMAISMDIAFRKASLVAIERGRTDSSSAE